MKKNIKTLLIILLALTVTVFGLVGLMKASLSDIPDKPTQTTSVADATGSTVTTVTSSKSSSTIPEYTGKPYVTLNGNQPEFDDFDNTTVFETYSELDSLGRCGVAFANICKELMPTEERGSISDVKPSGWTYNGKSNNHKYDTNLIDGGYIYNRCHLIGFQLAGENNNEKNLITGTRSLNIDGMLPFENMVADHIKEEGGHVLYRVTPRFVDNELVCRGVQIEAYSVEDNGEDICFNVFCFNYQKNFTINYLTGETYENDLSVTVTSVDLVTALPAQKYVVNDNSKKFHKIDCSAVKKISSNNRMVMVGSKEELVNQGYEPCKICKP